MDIEDSWASVLFISDYFAENQERVAPAAGNGHWNDPGESSRICLSLFSEIFVSRHAFAW